MKTRFASFAAAVTLAVSLSACSFVTITRSEPLNPSAAPMMTNGPVTVMKLDSFAWALVPRRLPSESEACPGSKIDLVHLYQNWRDVLLAVVTAGIYVPYRAEISCVQVP